MRFYKDLWHKKFLQITTKKANQASLAQAAFPLNHIVQSTEAPKSPNIFLVSHWDTSKKIQSNYTYHSNMV